MKQICAAVVLGIFAFIATEVAHASATPAQTCAAAKVKAAGLKVYAKAKCHQKALRTGGMVDAACLAKAEQKFVAGFAKAEAVGGCAVTGDAATVEAVVDECLTTFSGAIGGEARCAAAKMKAVGKKAYAKAKCQRKAFLTDAPTVDPLCLEKADMKFTTAIAKADGLGSCTATAASLGVLVDSCVQSLVPSLTTTSTTTSTSTTTTTIFASCGFDFFTPCNDSGGVCWPPCSPTEGICALGTFSGCTTDEDCTLDPGTYCMSVPILDGCAGACLAPTPNDYTCGISDAPACGGTCPAGQLCGQASGGNWCICVEPDHTCRISDAPACGGTCPDGSHCSLKYWVTPQICACSNCSSSLCPFESQWGSAGSGDGKFNYPEGVAVAGTGDVFVADTRNHRIQRFTNAGTFLTKWGSPGSGDGQFNFAAGIAIDGGGNVFVADQGNNRIQKFDDNGTFLTKWGSAGSGDGQFDQPLGVAVDGGGNVFVADSVNRRIQKFTNTGTFLAKWDGVGNGDGQFQSVGGVAVDGAGNVFVVDYLLNRIQKFTNTGTFLTKWGSGGSGDGQFSQPIGVAMDASGSVFVADSQNGRIQKFTNDGTFVGAVCFRGEFPWGVAVDRSSGRLFVSGISSPSIQKFACSLP